MWQPEVSKVVFVITFHEDSEVAAYINIIHHSLSLTFSLSQERSQHARTHSHTRTHVRRLDYIQDIQTFGYIYKLRSFHHCLL